MTSTDVRDRLRRTSTLCIRRLHDQCIATICECDCHTKRRPATIIVDPKPVDGDQPIRCDQCGREFRTDHALATHHNIIHSTAAVERRERSTPIACPECGNTFKTRAGLSGHRRSHETGTSARGEDVKASYLCVLCGGLAFATPQALGAHNRYHHAAKPGPEPEPEVEPVEVEIEVEVAEPSAPAGVYDVIALAQAAHAPIVSYKPPTTWAQVRALMENAASELDHVLAHPGLVASDIATIARASTVLRTVAIYLADDA